MHKGGLRIAFSKRVDARLIRRAKLFLIAQRGTAIAGKFRPKPHMGGNDNERIILPDHTQGSLISPLLMLG